MVAAEVRARTVLDVADATRAAVRVRAIARNIAHKHGGTLTLRNKPGGGLECLLVLPIQR
jgi:hypothetical protein